MTKQDRLVIRGMFAIIMNALFVIIYHGSGTHEKDVKHLEEQWKEFIDDVLNHEFSEWKGE